jgi:hypothetical protein
MKTLQNRILAAGLASAVALGAAASAVAEPVMTSTAMVKSAAPTATQQVRWRGGGGAAIAGGIIAGLAAGAIAGAASGPYYYGGGPYDYYPAPGPVYVEPGPVYPQTYYYRGGYGYGRDPAGCGPGTHIC